LQICFQKIIQTKFEQQQKQLLHLKFRSCQQVSYCYQNHILGLKTLNKFHIILEPAVCTNIRDFTDSNGNYLKTVCTVAQSQNQATARAVCSSYNMQLYRFVYPDDETALLAYSNLQWPKNQLWVEGGNTTSCLMVSNYNGGKFTKVSAPCSTGANFYCEYKSKNFLCGNLTQTKVIHNCVGQLVQLISLQSCFLL
jgi:hypothetical protein